MHHSFKIHVIRFELQVPWVGVAAPLSDHLITSPPSKDGSHTQPGSASAVEDGTPPCAGPGAKNLPSTRQGNLIEGGPLQGRAFVFLPLPLSTGLPAHINGCFELSRCKAALELTATSFTGLLLRLSVPVITLVNVSP